MREEIGHTDDSGYWISLSDLLAGLLIIFILTLCYTMLSYAEKVDRLEEIDDDLYASLRLRSLILQTIADSLKARDAEIEITVDTERGALLLPEGVLFGSGQAELSPRGRLTLETLGPVMHAILGQDRFNGQVETIFVEGHTDDRPISPSLKGKYESNWELSSKRAINAWRALSGSAALDSLRNDRGQPLFSCSGYADSRPVRDGETPEVRRLNRRIGLRFHMTPLSESKYWDRTISEALEK